MNAVTKPEGPTAAQVFRQQLEQRLDQFVEALPPHITVERFKSQGPDWRARMSDVLKRASQK